MTLVDLAIVVISLAVVVGIGILCGRGPKNTVTYLLGSRSIPWWAIGVSYMMSILSTLSIVSIPGEAYNNGLTVAIGQLFFPVFIVITFFLFIRFYFKSFVFTPFQYLENRFDTRVRTIAAGVFWLTRLAYLSLVLYSAAKVCEGAMGWPVLVTILMVGVIGITYTTLGGFRAVVWTDLIQFSILGGGLITTLVVALRAVPDGLAGAWEFANAQGHGFEITRDAGFFSFSPYVRVTLWMVILSPLAASLFANSADQISIQRLLGTKSYAQAKRSMLVFVALQLPTMLVLWTVGLAIFSFYGHQPEAVRPASGDLALFQFIGTQLPTPIPGIIMAGMLAAVLSTLDSATNSLATVATKDLYLRLFRQSASETQQVDFSRVMSVAIGVTAVAGAMLLAIVSGGLEESILEASRVWISFSGILAPIFLLGVTTRRLGATGAICAMLAGWLATLPVMGWYIWSRLYPEHGTVSFIITAAPPLFVTLAVGYLIAAFSPRQPSAKIDDLTLFTLREKHD